jgi:hypothetical protein
MILLTGALVVRRRNREVSAGDRALTRHVHGI